MQRWIIRNSSTGEVLHGGFVTPSYGSHPKDNGWAWDAATQVATRVDSEPDPMVQSIGASGGYVDDAAKVEAELVAAVKRLAEQRRMVVLTAGGSKKMVYAKKLAEVDYWNSLGGTVAAILAALALVPNVTRTRKLRYAYAEAACRGEANPSFAIARFQAGNDASEAEVARVEAIEQRAVAAIKAASTAAAKRAAFAAIDWAWHQ